MERTQTRSSNEVNGGFYVGDSKGPTNRSGLNCISFLRLPTSHKNESLKPFASVNFACIEIAARIRN